MSAWFKWFTQFGLGKEAHRPYRDFELVVFAFPFWPICTWHAGIRSEAFCWRLRYWRL